jgi:capsular polysaccharide transport system permease protein
MIDIKALLRLGQPSSTEISRGGLSIRHLERPTLREFPAQSDYNIITIGRRNAFLPLRRVGLFLMAFLPTLVVTIYFGLIAAPRYVAEAKFIVRTAAKASGGGINLTSILQITGLSRSQDDVFSVHEFMTSRDAIAQLMGKLALDQMYGRKQADFVARYPSIFFGSTREQFHKYFQWMISVSYSNNTGISTLRVQAFQPDDARIIAEALLAQSELLVNEMNRRIYVDAVNVSEQQVNQDEKRLISTQIALTNFRNRELMIDPASSAVVVSDVIKRLSNSLAETQTQVNEMTAASPSNPQLAWLQRRTVALTTQIAQERARISNSSDGLASKIGDFERLNLEREFAKQALTTSTSALEAARAEARRKQLYLERIVEPNTPDYPTAPASLHWIATVLGANALGLLIVWLFVAGIREHAGT